MEIISKDLVTVNLKVKEENTLITLFKVYVVDIAKEWQNALKLTALKWCFGSSFLICVWPDNSNSQTIFYWKGYLTCSRMQDIVMWQYQVHRQRLWHCKVSHQQEQNLCWIASQLDKSVCLHTWRTIQILTLLMILTWN